MTKSIFIGLNAKTRITALYKTNGFYISNDYDSLIKLNDSPRECRILKKKYKEIISCLYSSFPLFS